LKPATRRSRRFAASAKGYVVWDPAVPADDERRAHHRGPGGRPRRHAGAHPIGREAQPEKIDDLRGRYSGQTDAQIYTDAYTRYWARCTHDTHHADGRPRGRRAHARRSPTGACAQKMFFHRPLGQPDARRRNSPWRSSSSAELKPGGTVFGWHSYGKDTERQRTTSVSSYGLRMEGLPQTCRT